MRTVSVPEPADRAGARAGERHERVVDLRLRDRDRVAGRRCAP
jgi:hypothetical protein